MPRRVERRPSPSRTARSPWAAAAAAAAAERRVVMQMVSPHLIATRRRPPPPPEPLLKPPAQPERGVRLVVALIAILDFVIDFVSCGWRAVLQRMLRLLITPPLTSRVTAGAVGVAAAGSGGGGCGTRGCFGGGRLGFGLRCGWE